MDSESLDATSAREFANHLQTFKALPVLFVGSGLSRRYLKLPDWRGLLERFANVLEKTLPYYEGKTRAGLPGVASEIALDFYELWWSDSRFEESRDENQRLVKVYADPLKIEVSRYVESFDTSAADSDLVRELDAMRRVNAHAIITTNWDRLLERQFPGYEALVGQEQILFTDTQGVGEIYKIHGSAEYPTSIVICAEDYNEFERRNPYLLAKLMTLFVENPIVFMGYSLTDPHIQGLLSQLLECITEGNVEKLNNRLIFIRRPNRAGGSGLRMAPMLLKGHQLNILECTSSDFTPFYNIMANLHRRFPVRLLRQLKKEIYELAYQERPTGRIQVVDIDDETALDQVDVVIGVGTRARLGEKGYAGFSRRDLTKAMLRGDDHHDVEQIFKHVIPKVFGNPMYSPIFFPLYLDAKQGGSRHGNIDALPRKARDLVAGTTKLVPYGSYREYIGLPFSRLLELHPEQAAWTGLACSFDGPEDIEALRQFLLATFEDNARVADTCEYKLACKYDELVYGAKLKTLVLSSPDEPEK